MSDINVDPSVKAPDMYGPITTVRLYCTHANGDAIAPDEGFADMNVGMVITMTSLMLEMDDARHTLGLVFNEDTDTPFAVVNDFDGKARVCWNFKDDNDFVNAELSFETGLNGAEFLAYTIGLISGL